MKLILLGFLFAFSGTLLFGQGTYFKIIHISDTSTYNFNFPIIESANQLVQEKINAHLQLSELELLKGKSKSSIFERVQPNESKYAESKVQVDYEILANTSRSLAFRFTEVSSGLTMSYWTKYYNFNSQNGDRYSIVDFFTKANLAAFKKYVATVRKEKLRKQIAKEGYGDVELYSSIEKDELNDFYFTADSIYFDNVNLLHKNDMLAEFNHITAIAISDISHLLNEFGKSALITGKKLDAYRSTQEPQLYQGLIDSKYAFYLLFEELVDNEYIGTYAYTKYGVAIPLYGKLVDGRFNFDEKDENFDNTATISFTKAGTGFSGYWQGKNGTKLPFIASRK